VEWKEDGENGGEAVPGPVPGVSTPAARLRSRSLRVAVDDELVVALRALLGPEHVHLVKT